jgi:hypothetical protein
MRVGPSGAAVQEQVSNQPELLCSTPEDRVSIESEGYAEKYRVVIEGATPRMNRSAEGGARSSPHYGAKAFSFTHRTKVFADGTIRKNDA